MTNYLKFDLLDVIHDAQEAAVNAFHSVIGDGDTVERILRAYRDERAMAIVRINEEEGLDVPFEECRILWLGTVVRDMQKSAHSRWVRQQVIDILWDEVG